MGKRGCTNQQFVDYVHAQIKGDVTDSTEWHQLSSKDYGYKAFFPTKPFLEFSTTTTHGEVLSFEMWVAPRSQSTQDYSMVWSWKYSEQYPQVLNVQESLQKLIQIFYKGVFKNDPTVKLGFSDASYEGGRQVMRFKIKSETAVIDGKVFFVGDKSYLLADACEKQCNEMSKLIFLNSFQEIK